MSRNADVTFAWADRTEEEGGYTFRLGISQLRELQEKTDCGPLFLQQRIISGGWRIDDMRETLRLGLIGGGMEPNEALVLVSRYVDDRPLMEGVEPSVRVLSAALYGAPDEDNKDGDGHPEKTEGATEPSPLPTESSALPKSTETPS